MTDAYHLLRWAREQRRCHALTPAQAHVLLVLATYAHHATGEAFVRVEVLMADTGRSHSVIAAALRDLGNLGLLERTRRGPGRAALTRLLTSDPQQVKTSGGPDIKTSGPREVNRPDLLPAGGPDLRPATPKTSDPPEVAIERPQEQPQRTNLPNPPQAEGAVPSRPIGNRKRDHERDVHALTALAAEWFPNGKPTLAVQLITSARGLGKSTRAEVIAYAEQWYPQLLDEGAAA